MQLFTSEQKENFKKQLNASITTGKSIAWNTFKYGSIFGSGVLAGTVVGICLFLYLNNEPE